MCESDSGFRRDDGLFWAAPLQRCRRRNDAQIVADLFHIDDYGADDRGEDQEGRHHPALGGQGIYAAVEFAHFGTGGAHGFRQLFEVEPYIADIVPDVIDMSLEAGDARFHALKSARSAAILQQARHGLAGGRFRWLLGFRLAQWFRRFGLVHG
jgi:hypothetical protein